MKKRALEIDGILGSQLRDTQGETLSVEGADISDLEAGRGRWNDNHGKGFFNSLGCITTAKKIFKVEDCTDPRHKYYWDMIKTPFIYGRGYLFDDEEHPNAKAAAAILRNIHKSDSPLKLKLSVEGGVISRGIADKSLLARTKIHSCAITFTPANNATLVEPLNLDKSSYDEAADMELIKSVLHLAETNIPSFRHIARDASASKVEKNLQRIAELMKGDADVSLPTKQEILDASLESKIKSNVARIHELVAELREEEMEKGWKDAAAGAAMMGAAAAGLGAKPANPPVPQVKAPVAAATPAPDLSNMGPEHQKTYQEIAKKNPLLGAIGMIESSGGKNYKHSMINDPDSMHHQHVAGGMFGMMPNSASFILARDPELAKKYPDLVEAAKDMKTNHGKFTERFNGDPKAAIEFAEAFFNRNKKKTKNRDMLVHSWNHGLKGTWERYKKDGMDAITSAPYVQNVLKTFNKMNKKPQKEAVKKALTAGYGGAGSPTSLGGGGVFQAEMVEQGRPKLKYVNCENCGKEQVYGKHQVKCRQCGHNWSLEKLFRVMKGIE